jgi:ABC-2 type transport system ATP-binding protein
MMETPMLEVQNISKSYRGKQVLGGISFAAPAGVYACVVGQNGSGKSTLLQILAGMLCPDSGDAKLCGNSLRSSAYTRSIGYVAQNDSLFGHLSVKDNIAFWASAAGLGMKAPGVTHFTRLLGIDSFWKQKVSTLSGGQRRRVAICTALMHSPTALLLDEPFTGLDLIVKEELFLSLEELRLAGKVIVYTTHNIDELPEHGKLIVLRGGEAIEVSPDGTDGDFRSLVPSLIKGAAT